MATIVPVDPKNPQSIEGNRVVYYWEDNGARYSVTAAPSAFGGLDMPGGAPTVFQVYNSNGKLDAGLTKDFQREYEIGNKGSFYSGVANSILPAGAAVFDLVSGNLNSKIINHFLPANAPHLPEMPNPYSMASQALQPAANATSEQRFAYNSGWWTGVGIQTVAGAPDAISLLRQAPQLVRGLLTRGAADVSAEMGNVAANAAPTATPKPSFWQEISQRSPTLPKENLGVEVFDVPHVVEPLTLAQEQAQELASARIWYSQNHAGTFPTNPEEIQSVVSDYRIAQARIQAANNPNYTLDEFTRDSMRLNGEPAPTSLSDLAPPKPNIPSPIRSLAPPTRAEIVQARAAYVKDGLRAPPKPGSFDEIDMVWDHWERMAREDFVARNPGSALPPPNSKEGIRLIETYRSQHPAPPVETSAPPSTSPTTPPASAAPVPQPTSVTTPAPVPAPVSLGTQIANAARGIGQTIVDGMKGFANLPKWQVAGATTGLLAVGMVALPSQTPSASNPPPAATSNLVSPPGGTKPPEKPFPAQAVNNNGTPVATPPAAAAPPSPKPAKPKAAPKHVARNADPDSGPVDPNDPSEVLNTQELARIQREYGTPHPAPANSASPAVPTSARRPSYAAAQPPATGQPVPLVPPGALAGPSMPPSANHPNYKPYLEQNVFLSDDKRRELFQSARTQPPKPHPGAAFSPDKVSG